MAMLKKIAFFILGLIVVPLGVGLPFLFLGSDIYEDAIEFFGGVYLIIYLLVPLLYHKKLQEFISNRYVFYGVLYIPFIVLFLLAKIA